jgi:hypothetical protein
MATEKSLREHVISLLKGGGAHVNFEAAFKDFPPELRGKRPKGADHSPWEVLEHMRIALWDIVEFTRNPKHVSPQFPSGYWPSSQAPPDAKAWDKSVHAFRADSKALAGLVADESTDLLAPLAHSNEHTVLREALVAADHNAYHLGELVLIRRLLGAWSSS